MDLDQHPRYFRVELTTVQTYRVLGMFFLGQISSNHRTYRESIKMFVLAEYFS